MTIGWLSFDLRKFVIAEAIVGVLIPQNLRLFTFVDGRSKSHRYHRQPHNNLWKLEIMIEQNKNIGMTLALQQTHNTHTTHATYQFHYYYTAAQPHT